MNSPEDVLIVMACPKNGCDGFTRVRFSCSGMSFDERGIQHAAALLADEIRRCLKLPCSVCHE